MVKVVKRTSLTPGSQEGKTEEVLKKLETTSREEAGLRLANKAGLPYIDLAVFPLEGDDVRTFPETEARSLQIALFQKEHSIARFALADPENPEALAAIKAFAAEHGFEAKAYVVSSASLEKAWAEYAKKPFIEHLDSMRISLSGEDLRVFETDFGDLLSLKNSAHSVPTSRAIEIILAGAAKLRASDIHIEPEEEGARLRYRIDGILEDIGHLPSDMYRLGLSRIKMLGKMKLNIRERSQDGHFFIMQNDKRIDIRVNLIPSSHGETINMRLLTGEDANVPIEELGLHGSAYEEIKRQIERPHGMIINTGPTGSGKTTTLYSLVRAINTPEIKIITVEDPIEYTIPGVVQTEVSPGQDYDFAKALRAIVRQDPDVILVGEIRDDETAEVAVNAALTGHLVFTTLHTNDAPASITRLGELGIKAQLIGSAVNLFIGQRLVRILCPECKAAYTPATKTVEALKKLLATIPKEAGVVLPEITVLYKPVGCASCNFSGYRGRKGIFEIFPVRDRIAKLINEYASEQEIRKAAREQGMLTMNQDGILKVIEGRTTFEEVWRNTGRDEALEALYNDILENSPGEAPLPEKKA
ncbi:MAG: hypothetical protein A2808_03690 [Candidatus Moranbacteria bacterium RIFCSPHIGHO2_01_FULL_55_24]|nr:MAG: hypothetical protein A2808_03690 [Candidatus Moranbacteria bacterium RIFCSPHIGHO2_01_FULL_55_24]